MKGVWRPDNEANAVSSSRRLIKLSQRAITCAPNSSPWRGRSVTRRVEDMKRYDIWLISTSLFRPSVKNLYAPDLVERAGFGGGHGDKWFLGDIKVTCLFISPAYPRISLFCHPAISYPQMREPTTTRHLFSSCTATDFITEMTYFSYDKFVVYWNAARASFKS